MKLATLLGNNHPNFIRNMYELERASGNAGVDTRLLAEINQTAQQVMRELKLNVNDTTSRELYHALNAAVRSGKLALFANTQFVLHHIDGEVVSFNIHDVIDNMHHGLQFDNRRLENAKRRLRLELVKRYAEHDRTDDTIVRNIASQSGIYDKKDQGHLSDTHYVSASVNKSADAPSILMIGDIFTDAFVKLDENYAFVEKDDNGKEWLKLPFGDKPPYEKVDIIRSVGPSPNSAISCARLGLKASLMTWLGDDDTGLDSMQHLKHENVDVSSVELATGLASSYWYVLRHGTDRTMLVKSESYKYEWKVPTSKPDWIYLAYIGENSWQLHEDLLEYLNQNPDIKFVFQPATYHFKWGTEKMKPLYKRANVVIMNREEAVSVTARPYEDVSNLAKGLHEMGPDIVAITDGAGGSYVLNEGKLMNIENYPDPKPPTDRTGAGDAFASTFIAALALGETVEVALTWAPINSASVVQQVGAQGGLLRMEELQDWLARAPQEYKVKYL